MQVPVAFFEILSYDKNSKMKQTSLYQRVIIVLSVLLLFGVFASQAVLVLASSTFYFIPSKKYISFPNTQVVDLWLNTDGEAVNAFSAYMQYPQDILSISDVSASTAFPIVAEKSFNAGSIRITRGTISPVSGNMPLETFVLKGLSEGVAHVSFVAGSAAPRYSDSSDSLSLARSIDGVYTVTGVNQNPIHPLLLQPLSKTPTIQQNTVNTSLVSGTQTPAPQKQLPVFHHKPTPQPKPQLIPSIWNLWNLF